LTTQRLWGRTIRDRRDRSRWASWLWLMASPPPAARGTQKPRGAFDGLFSTVTRTGALSRPRSVTAAANSPGRLLASACLLRRRNSGEYFDGLAMSYCLPFLRIRSSKKRSLCQTRGVPVRAPCRSAAPCRWAAGAPRCRRAGCPVVRLAGMRRPGSRAPHQIRRVYDVTIGTGHNGRLNGEEYGVRNQAAASEGDGGRAGGHEAECIDPSDRGSRPLPSAEDKWINVKNTGRHAPCTYRT